MSPALPRATALVLALVVAPAWAQHAGHAQHGTATPPAEPAQHDEHAAHRQQALPHTPVPPPTDADRAAAVAPSSTHAHGNGVHSFVLFDRLERWHGDGSDGLAWDAVAWIGSDAHRLWLRSEGETVGGRREGADLEVLYGRPVAAWWDLVAGARHEFGADGRDWVAVGVTGLTPYKFEFAATLYVGAGGRSEATLELEYETLLTNRLILQSSLEATLAGRDDGARGIGTGLATLHGGLRLRYEFNRRFAPYIGIERERAFAGTADARRRDGEAVDATRVVAGLRLWF